MFKTNPKVFVFLIISSLLCYGVVCRPGGYTPDYEVKYKQKEMLLSDAKKQPKGFNMEGRLMGEDARRMIGSTAPPCTINECKGCRLKCSAEQVPVDASDPMNSAYRYKCICHR